MSLSELVKISNRYGTTPGYVLAGGGNTSYKDDQYLYVKGSGTTLADITADGFVKMDRSALSLIWSTALPEEDAGREACVLELLMDSRAKGEYHKRPSVETSVHDLLPGAYVVHLHPALVGGLVCSVKGGALTKTLFGDDAIYLGATKPGYSLAAAIREKSSLFGKSGILLIENHGIFVWADEPSQIDHYYDKVMGTLRGALTAGNFDPSSAPTDRKRAALLAPVIRMMLKSGDTSIVTFGENKSLLAFLADEKSFAPIARPYTPDHIVYCGAAPLYVGFCEDMDAQYAALGNAIEGYKAKYGSAPKVIAVQGLGIFAHGNTKNATDTILALFMDNVEIAVYTKSFGGHQFMDSAMEAFIRNWEAESYRQSVAATATSKRINEKIAIVTGSAQGFGKGVAQSMLMQGANVVIADLNFELAELGAEECGAQFGKGKVLAVKVDVGNEESVEEMITQTVLSFGGLDVFVNNAGVVKAGSLDEMDVKSFEFVTRINYTAYYLGAKYASKIMKLQHRFDRKYYTDIVQINSKSGLSGSNKNFAYAGSKFGGIGLTQSFALELVEYNIKVNSICPGNFFDGPLWSDPEKGLFVQYLEAGKVPGAKTVEDVKRFYEAKVPMNRGCSVEDVASAIFYCMEQRYETGQAIPVTGGQNMLK